MLTKNHGGRRGPKRGGTVKTRRGPAAVTGDENRTMPLSERREGAASRMNRKPEDLPMMIYRTTESLVVGDNA